MSAAQNGGNNATEDLVRRRAGDVYRDWLPGKSRRGHGCVIVKATTSEYWQWVFKGAEDAGKLLGVKVE